MDDILQSIGDAIHDFFVDVCGGMFIGIFDDANAATGDIASQVGLTPSQWNGSIFTMIQNLSKNVVIPIAGLIITFVLCYELITMITEKNNMPDIIKSASMTADWENALSLIAQGKFTHQQFMVDIEKLVDDIIGVAKESVDESKVSRNGGEVIGTCPRCGKNIVVTPKAYSCEDRNCGFVIWKNDKFFEKARKPLTKEMAASLIKNGKIAVKGLYSEKSGKNYDATVCLDDTGKYVNYKDNPIWKKSRKFLEDRFTYQGLPVKAVNSVANAPY